MFLNKDHQQLVFNICFLAGNKGSVANILVTQLCMTLGFIKGQGTEKAFLEAELLGGWDPLCAVVLGQVPTLVCLRPWLGKADHISPESRVVGPITCESLGFLTQLPEPS